MIDDLFDVRPGLINDGDDSVQGILHQAGEYKILPRSQDDLGLIEPVWVNDIWERPRGIGDLGVYGESQQ